MKKKTLITRLFGGLTAVLLVGSVFLYLNNQKASNGPEFVLQEATEQVSEVEEEKSQDTETPKPKTPFEKAQATLEHPENKLDNEKATATRESIKTLINAVVNTEENKLSPKREDRTLLSKIEDLELLKGYLSAGYTFSIDDVTVYQSDYDDVTQFVLLLKNSNKTIAVTGNFQSGVEQVQIGVFKE